MIGIASQVSNRPTQESSMVDLAEDTRPLVNGVGSRLIGQHVVVRTRWAGVHLGELVEKDGTNVLLKNSRRLWKWNGAFTLSEVATSGISKSGSRIAVTLPVIELTEAIEIIPTSDVARAKFDDIHE